MKRYLSVVLMCAVVMISGCSSKNNTVEAKENEIESIAEIEQGDIAVLDMGVIIQEEDIAEEDMLLLGNKDPEALKKEKYVFNPDGEMPDAFDPELCYADYNQNYYIPLSPLISNIDSDLIDLVGEEKFEEWCVWVSENDEIATDINEIFGLYSFLRYCNPDKDVVKAKLIWTMEFWASLDNEINYTKEGIDALVNGDKETVIRLYKNDSAIYYNGKLYSPEWLYCKPVSEWKKEGITAEMVMEVYHSIMKQPFTEEGAEAFSAKVAYYCDGAIKEGK